MQGWGLGARPPSCRSAGAGAGADTVACLEWGTAFTVPKKWAPAPRRSRATIQNVHSMHVPHGLKSAKIPHTRRCACQAAARSVAEGGRHHTHICAGAGTPCKPSPRPMGQSHVLEPCKSFSQCGGRPDAAGSRPAALAPPQKCEPPLLPANGRRRARAAVSPQPRRPSRRRALPRRWRSWRRPQA